MKSNLMPKNLDDFCKLSFCVFVLSCSAFMLITVHGASKGIYPEIGAIKQSIQQSERTANYKYDVIQAQLAAINP